MYVFPLYTSCYSILLPLHSYSDLSSEPPWGAEALQEQVDLPGAHLELEDEAAAGLRRQL